MSVASHIEHLQTKHTEFDKSLAEEMARPSPNFFVIKDLKKQKLLLKEEIMHLTQEIPRRLQGAS